MTAGRNKVAEATKRAKAYGRMMGLTTYEAFMSMAGKRATPWKSLPKKTREAWTMAGVSAAMAALNFAKKEERR